MGFFNKYPYTDFHELNLDWVLEEIKKVNSASGVTFDDETSQIGATNVQEAIDILKADLVNVASLSSAFKIIDNDIALQRWNDGYSYSHLQTINNPTLTAIIDGVRNDKFITLKTIDNNEADYFYLKSIQEIPGDYQHIVEFFDPFNLVTLSVTINGLNDDQNVFCVINAAVVGTVVNSFNTRSGDVLPQASDYDADQIDYDNSVSNLAATDVQDAIDEVNNKFPANNVETFNTRAGDVMPTDHDYAANQIDYNNAVSHLQSTNVQNAIDEMIGMVIAAGVASFNGRAGIVLPQAGDYDAGQIDFDPTNTSLSPAAITVQKAIEELSPAQITVTLTINGAKEDSITIYDSNNNQVGSCVFAPGQTNGTCQIIVTPGGGSYKFVSSVAKGTTLATITNDYEKTVTITGAATQTVNVYPDNVPIWYGNETVAMSDGAWPGDTVFLSPIKNTNDLAFTANNNKNVSLYITDSEIDLSQFSKVKVVLKRNSQIINANIVTITTRDVGTGTMSFLLSLNGQTDNDITLLEADISAVTDTDYFGIDAMTYSGGQIVWYDFKIYALILE